MTDPTARRSRAPTRLGIWIDPGCPWAWQTALWARELRDRGLVTIDWRLFSLEVNTAGVEVPFEESAVRYGESLTALALAHEEGGPPEFEALYDTIGQLLHDDEAEPISPELVRRAAAGAGLGDIVERASGDPRLAEVVLRAYRQARELDVFGVPTLQLGDGPVIYGPILPEAPTGDDALEWWHHVSWLIERDDLYELKRWPRSRRPARRSLASA